MVSKQLRHSRTSDTLDIYTHLIQVIKVIKISGNQKTVKFLILQRISRFSLMDLAGIEPASESLSIQASPITVILFKFPPHHAG